MIFGSGGDLPARFRAAGPAISTTLMCRPQHLHRLHEATGNARVVALAADAPDDEWIAMARAVHAVDPVTRVVMFGEHDQDRAAAVAEALGFDCHPSEVVRLVHDKHAMRQRLAAAGVEDTPAAIVSDLTQLRSFVDRHGLPCVVKPLGGTASFGVSMVRGSGELSAAYQRAARPHDGVTLRDVLVETYLHGDQYSVEAFSEGGEHVVAAVTRKYSSTASLIELGHVLPAPLDPEQHDAITSHVRRALDALGIAFGPTHTEVVLTPDGPRIIETHLRPGGDDIFAMVADAVGVDLIGFHVRQSLGEKVLPTIRDILDDPERERRCCAIWFATAAATGDLVEITGLDEHGNPCVETKPLTTPGTRLGGLDSSYSRLAQARAYGQDAASALTLAQQAVGLMRFVTRTQSPPPAEAV